MYYQDMIENWVEEDLDILTDLLTIFKKLDLIEDSDWEYEFEDTLERGCMCGGCYETTTIGFSLYVDYNDGDRYEISSV